MATTGSKKKRQGCFSLTDQEEADKSAPLAIASRIPPVVKSGNKFRDEELRLCRLAMIRAMQNMWRNPDITHGCAAWTDERLAVGIDKASAVVATRCSKTLKQVDIKFAAPWIARQVDWVTVPILEAALEKDPDTLAQCLAALLGAKESVRLPGELVDDPEVQKVAFNKQSRCVGRRMALPDGGSVNDGVTHAGMINWPLIGSYRPMFQIDQPVASSVLHQPTNYAVDLPEYVVITRGFHIVQNWSDLTAQATLGKRSENFYDLFPDGHGPKSYTPWLTETSQFMKTQVDEAKLEVERFRCALSAPRSEQFMDAARKRKQEAGAEHARKRLRDKKTELLGLRTAKLSQLR